MIDARNLFREGFIRIERPFDFAEMEEPIQKYTIVYAYAESLYKKKVLTRAAQDDIEFWYSCSALALPKGIDESIQEARAREVERITEYEGNYEEEVLGQILQANIDGVTFRLYPDEYTILTKEQVTDYMERPGWHVIPQVESTTNWKNFKDQVYFSRQRGISKADAVRWASLAFPGSVYYKPYFDLLDKFVRQEHIYVDTFYRRVEGIKMWREKKGRKSVLYHEHLPD